MRRNALEECAPVNEPYLLFPGKKQSQILSDQSGYVYCFGGNRKNGCTSWRCKRQASGCKAYVLTYADAIIRKSYSHHHPQEANDIKRIEPYFQKWKVLLVSSWLYGRGTILKCCFIFAEFQSVRGFVITTVRHTGRLVEVLRDDRGFTYSYSKTAYNGGTHRWRCSKKSSKAKCRAYVMVQEDRIVREPYEHNHLP